MSLTLISYFRIVHTKAKYDISSQTSLFSHIFLTMKLIVCENDLDDIGTLKQSVQPDVQLLFSDNPYDHTYQQQMIDYFADPRMYNGTRDKDPNPSLNPDVPPNNSDNRNNETQYLAFLFHDRSIPYFPFFRTSKQKTYFSDDFLEHIRLISLNHPNLIIDLISCNINEPFVIEEIKQVENNYNITIRHSFDETGSSNMNGNWIMESHNINIKPIYFTADIRNWNVTLQLSFHSGFIRNTAYGKRVYMMGNNEFGQLGNGTYKHSDLPVDITDHIDGNSPSSTTFIPKMVACGNSHTLILSQDGKVAVCGSNLYGQLGLGQNHMNMTENKPKLINSINSENIKYISCGPDYSLLLSDKKIWMFGNNSSRIIQFNNTQFNDKYIRDPIIVYNLIEADKPYHNQYNKFLNASCGQEHLGIVVKKEDNKTCLWTKGHNQYGQLGISFELTSVIEDNSFVQIDVSNIDIAINYDISKCYVTYVNCGGFHTGMIVTDITIDSDYVEDKPKPYYKNYAFSTGLNKYKQLGIQNYTDPSLCEFQRIRLEKPANDGTNVDINIRYIACGRYHTQILSSDGIVFGFGQNYYNQSNYNENNQDTDGNILNNNAYSDLKIVDPNTNKTIQAVSIACSAYHSLILTTSNKLYMLGTNGSQFAYQDVDSANNLYVNRIMNVPRFDQIIYHHKTNHIAFVCSNNKIYTFGRKGISYEDTGSGTKWNNLKRTITDDVFADYNYDLEASDLSYSNQVYVADFSGVHQVFDDVASVASFSELSDLNDEIQDLSYSSIIMDGSHNKVELHHHYDMKPSIA